MNAVAGHRWGLAGVGAGSGTAPAARDRGDV